VAAPHDTLIAFILYAAILVATSIPGLPVGWRLFGRAHPAGWVTGATIGYALTALVIWAVIRAGIAGATAFVSAWAILTAIAWIALPRNREPLVSLDRWTGRDTLAYLAALVLTTAIAAPPFLKLGSHDAAGNQYYRAYFTADFVWHTALTAEVGKFSMPPRNPFLRQRPIHYYWTYFLVPAAVSRAGPAPLRDVERCLKLNAFFTGLLFVSSIFMSVRAAVPSGGAALASVALALVASSAEGTWELVNLWRAGEPLSSVRFANIDAMTAWRLHGYRVDGLQRAIWYNPQHSMAAALGLAAMIAAAAGGSARSLSSGALAGLALAGSVIMNPFVGVMFSMAYGVAAVVDGVRRQFPIRRILFTAAAAVPVALAVWWCQSNAMVEGAGAALQFGFTGISRNAPLTTLLLSLGPALLPAIAGGFVMVAIAEFTPFVPAAALAAGSLVLMYFARLSADEYWIGFRTGHLLLVSLPVLSARLFLSTWERVRPLAVAIVLAVLIAGLPTLLIDAYNAQDLSNREPSPGGFPWTRVVTPDEQAAFRWIREATPATAIVQEDSLSRSPGTWWVVPTFGQRRMAAGIPPFMLEVPEYSETSKHVRDMYATTDPSAAWSIGHSLRIEYIYVDEVERTTYPQGVAKFNDARYFTPVFSNAAVQIYKLK
jgi:hypothetical protein